MGAPTTFAHAPVLTAPQLELAKTVDGLLPDQFSVCTTVTPDCPGGYQTGCGDLMLLGGDAALENGGCGALYIFWRQDPEPPHGGYLGFGVQCNGGDSETTLDSSPPHRLSSGKAYEVEYRYDRSTKAAEMLVDGVTQASATRAWNFPHDGSVTLMAGSHSSATEERLYGQLQDVRIYSRFRAPRRVGGWALVLVLLGGGVFYAGAGVIWGRRSSGSGSAADAWWQAHPHASRWLDLSCMVRDGVTFARLRVAGIQQGDSGGGGGAYEKLEERADTAEARVAAAEEQAKRTRRALKKAEKQLGAAATGGGEGGSGKKSSSSKSPKGKREREEKDGRSLLRPSGGADGDGSSGSGSGGGGGGRSSTAAGDGARWVKVDAATAASLPGGSGAT